MFKIIAVYSTLVFILCLCLGCEKSKEIKEKVIEPKCISSQSDCFIRSANGDFSILFNQEPVITETPFNISLISHTQHTIKKITAHMEGKNMFMGKIPLFFEPLSNETHFTESTSTKLDPVKNESSVIKVSTSKMYYVADTMLGSCSKENMRWIIYFKISLESIQGQLFTESFTVEFDSLRR